MLDAVRRPLTADQSMQPAWKDGSPTSAVVEQFIKRNDRLTSFERLQIYNQQYWWRLLGALAEDFPGLYAVLGERKFDKLANAYLESCPSKSWTLDELGKKLPAFLVQHPELTAPYSALSSDMARVEWAQSVAFDGPERKPLNPQRLAGSDPDKLRLRLQPYLTLLELKYPIDELLRRRKQRAESGSASNAVSQGTRKRNLRLSARPSRKPIYLAVHRVNLFVYFKRLDPAAYRLLKALDTGSPLATACAEAFTGSKDLPEKCAANIQQYFAMWTQFGWFY